jgi:Tfp pilus assembly protein PilX
MKRLVDNQRGFALLSVFLLLLLALSLGAATMFFTLLDFRSTAHFATGNQAFAASESGLIDAINTINTRGVVNFKHDVIDAGLIPTASTAVYGYSNVTYQLTLASGANTWTDGILTAKGNQTILSGERVIKVTLKRGPLEGGAGALHLSNDAAVGSFSGNSMTIDGNNWLVTYMDSNTTTAVLDPSVPTHPAISTRSDTVTTQVVTALAGQGTIIGLGSAPSVWTTNAGSTAELQRFVDDILLANGAPTGCNQNGNGKKDYWLPGPCNSGPPGSECGVHCVNQTNGHTNDPDKWGTLAVPNVTYVSDTNASIHGGSFGAGVLIFAGDATMGGNFNYCGWVLFLNPSAGGLKIGGNPLIYGEVLSPLSAFSGNGGMTVRYSADCLQKADSAGLSFNGMPPANLPHPMVVTSWAEQ